MDEAVAEFNTPEQKKKFIADKKKDIKRYQQLIEITKKLIKEV